MRKSREEKPKQPEKRDLTLDLGLPAKKQEKNWYISFARRAGAMFKASDEYKDKKLKSAVEFLGWDLRPKEVKTAPTLAMFIGFAVALPVLGILGYLAFVAQSFDQQMFLYVACVVFLAPLFLTYYVQNYPKSAAKAKRMQAITFIPEIVNYIVMSMKLSPNLENAVKFAAEHGRGKIAEDLKQLSWDVSVGKYRSIEEGLDELAYKWGEFSEEFKHAMMVIRSSVIEVDESKRNALLDKAVTDTLESTSENMTNYVNEMRQPSIYLYYLGVLLPLMMIIMLPIGSAMAGLPLSETKVLVALYNILIPLATFVFAMNILGKRPLVYTPPEIPDSFPGLPRKGHLRVGRSEMPAILLAAIAFIAVYVIFSFVLEPVLNPYPPAWNKEAIAAYFKFFQIAGIFFGAAVAAAVYIYGIFSAKRKAQLEIMQMEKEFKDSIYIMASRLGENRPMEDAVAHTSEFLSDAKISSVFQKTADNIRNMGMTVGAAFFDEIYGSLRFVPSEMIRGSMKIVIDSITLGVQQAARALVSLSLQLRDSEKIQDKIKSMLEEITSMMSSIAFMIAPLVLGITTALQRIIINALKSACGQTAEVAAGAFTTSSMPISICKDPAMLELIPSPTMFMLIMAFYVVELTVILVYFTSQVKEGSNRLSLFMSIAKTLPVSLLFFFASAFMATQVAAVIG
ncbi:MAG: hypothetical protein QXO69_03055 [archaeon]